MEEYYTHLKEGLLLEMAEIGRFKEFKIIIYGSEGPVPHLHFESLDGKIDGCLRLDKPEYFKHGKHISELNSKDRKYLIEWLKSPHKYFGQFGLTNWQIICVYWDDNNPNHLFNKKAEMPDYSQLK